MAPCRIQRLGRFPALSLVGRSVLASAAGVLLGCAGTGGPASELGPYADDIHVGERIDRLHSELASFADRFLGRYGEVIEEALQRAESRVARRELLKLRFTDSLAVVEMAGGANPAASLLDLMVLLSLRRAVLEGEALAERLGSEAREALLSAVTDMGDDVWRLGQDYLSDEFRAKVTDLATEWLAANPGREYVASVRFRDFDRLRGGEALSSDLDGSGLFSSMDKAAESADTATRLLARFKFVGERMPLLIGWQVELVAQELIAIPDVERAVVGLVEASAALERTAASVEELPRLVRDEADALSSLLSEARATLEEARATVGETAAPAAGVADAYRTAAEAVTEMVRATDELAQRFRDDEGGAARGDGFDVARYQAAAEEIAVAAREVNAVLDSTAELLGGAAWQRRLQDLEDASHASIDHASAESRALVASAFWRGLIAIALTGLVAVACVVAVRRLGGPASSRGDR